MKRILFLAVLLCGCGSGGGDDGLDDEDLAAIREVTVQPQPTPVQNTYCEHDGALFICADQACEAAKEEENSVTAVEETTQTDSLGQTTPAKAITINGAVHIVAECGSSVSFEVSDNASSVTGVPSATE